MRVAIWVKAGTDMKCQRSEQAQCQKAPNTSQQAPMCNPIWLMGHVDIAIRSKQRHACVVSSLKRNHKYCVPVYVWLMAA